MDSKLIHEIAKEITIAFIESGNVPIGDVKERAGKIGEFYRTIFNEISSVEAKEGDSEEICMGVSR